MSRQMLLNLTNLRSENGLRPIDAQRRSAGLAVWNTRARLVTKAMIRVLLHIKVSECLLYLFNVVAGIASGAKVMCGTSGDFVRERAIKRARHARPNVHLRR
jgi:hypothetical protein